MKDTLLSLFEQESLKLHPEVCLFHFDVVLLSLSEKGYVPHMAKQRCLPTSFFKDPDVMTLSSGDVRLMLIGLVLNADDEGRGLAHARILGRELDYPPEVIESALQEMEACELVQCYQVERHRYYSLRRWGEWQTLSKPTQSRFPAPPPLSSPDTFREAQDPPRFPREMLASPGKPSEKVKVKKKRNLNRIEPKEKERRSPTC